MKALRLLALGVLVLGATMATCVGQAAAAARLYILDAGQPVVTSEQLGIQVFLENGASCSLQSPAYGSLLTNGKAKDSMRFPEPQLQSCSEEPPGYAISGQVISVQFAASGSASLKASPKIALTQPVAGGSCVYETAKLEGKWVNEAPFAEGTTKAKLNKGASLSTCPKTESVPFLAEAYDSTGADLNLHLEVR
ncbi:MAG TPA: hypothetical protein VGD00_00785 [Solirubrobacteraceae bacterium]